MAAYFVFSHEVTDLDKLQDQYLPRALQTLAPFNPEILVVDPAPEVVEGESKNTRTVILKFKDKQQARQWYESADYQSIIHLRLEAVNGGAVLCDAFEPPA
ncbi:MAG: DUF1330 domain-containing protein [Pseudomonadota bacterium]